MSQILVSGSLAYDHIMDLPGLFKDFFLPDKLHNINVSFTVPDHAEHFGGTAGNIAYSLALLGEKPVIISTAGNDFDRYKKHLEEAGVPTESIHVRDELSTAFAYIVADKANNQISAFHPGAAGVAYGEVVPIDGAACAVITPGSFDDMRTLPNHYREKKVSFFFDPGQVIPALTIEDLKNGIEGAEGLFANDYEFALISQRTGWSESDILDHAKMLIITLGAEGSRILTKGGGEITVNAVKAESVDPTGAGDAYRAGFLTAFHASKPPAACAKLASTVAAYAVEKVGTQSHHFTREELTKRYEAAYNETLVL